LLVVDGRVIEEMNTFIGKRREQAFAKAFADGLLRSIDAVGERPSGPGFSMPASICRRSAATRTMKNSSRLLA
jgi:hypothetical protein